MKRLIILLFFPLLSYSQSPSGVNYQAVARDSVGAILANTAIDIQFSIISSTTTGNVEYKEQHSATTNDFGLFSLIIGQGTYISGNSTIFKDIDWGSSIHFVKVDMDATSNGNYIHMGTTQIMTVPYSFYAEEAGKIKGGGSSAKTLMYLGGM
jgi:hypothetical protein